MSVLNDDALNKLLSEIKAYLGITWDDPNGDNLLKTFIKLSAKRLESVFGGNLDFIDGEEAYEQLAHELLLNRVFYQREKAVDDFETNYRSELLTLRNYGKIKQKMDKENAEQQ